MNIISASIWRTAVGAALCCILLAAALQLIIPPPAVSAETRKISEYQAKAAFVYNFIRYVEWNNASTAADPIFHIAVIGTDPIVEAITSLNGKTAKGKRIAVSHLTSFDSQQKYQILFVCGSERKRLAHILANSGSGTLTVSDLDGFINKGGMIALVLDEDKLGFKINLSTAGRAGLTISSYMLRVAREVIPVHQ